MDPDEGGKRSGRIRALRAGIKAALALGDAASAARLGELHDAAAAEAGRGVAADPAVVPEP